MFPFFLIYQIIKFCYFLKNGVAIIEDVKPATKVAVIRCDIVSEACPGMGCFMAFNKRSVHFEQYDDNTEMVAFFTWRMFRQENLPSDEVTEKTRS
ncbi:CGGC domain-containing protein [uncultured Methanolobus sp.]|uniref:CGGC domain-containing protein n=1 Tax=uncultured Methanolobus sp. TaxID=218300 RepID=UPI002AAB61D8|nr:CGGC domain-containing protein [uncultured Methanolobus sp.]